MKIEPKTYIVQRNNVFDLQEFLDSAHCELGGYAKEFISSEDFSANNANEEIKFKLVSFEKDLLIVDILKEIQDAGYTLPQAQDAVWFASQYPNVQKDFPIAFLHTPWVRPETRGENVLILRSYGDVRYLHMHLFDSRWYSHVRFAVLVV